MLFSTTPYKSINSHRTINANTLNTDLAAYDSLIALNSSGTLEVKKLKLKHWILNNLHLRAECMPKGIELLINYLEELKIQQNAKAYEYSFLHGDSVYKSDHRNYISLQELLVFNFQDLPINILNDIKEKAYNFVQSQKSIGDKNNIAWNQLATMLLELHDVQELTVFKKISKLKLIVELATVIDKPYCIEQPYDSNLCGPTSILTYIFSEMPEKFIPAVQEFFNKGKTIIPFKMVANYYSKNEEDCAIIAMIIGMKHASNYLGYNNKILYNNDCLETYFGITEPSQMINWLHSLGYKNAYEDISIHVPYTNYNMPKYLANVLLFRNVYSANHKTIINPADRIPSLKEHSSDNKMILLIDEYLWGDISIECQNKELKGIGSNNCLKVSYTKDINQTFRQILKIKSSSTMNVGHYVYLYNLQHLPQQHKFACVFYADGMLLETEIDETTFLNGLKGIISINPDSNVLQKRKATEAEIENNESIPSNKRQKVM